MQFTYGDLQEILERNSKMTLQIPLNLLAYMAALAEQPRWEPGHFFFWAPLKISSFPNHSTNGSE